MIRDIHYFLKLGIISGPRVSLQSTLVDIFSLKRFKEGAKIPTLAPQIKVTLETYVYEKPTKARLPM